MQTHICSLDGQLWKVISIGPEKFLKADGKEKEVTEYDDADFKKLEKNERAKKVLHHALTSSEIKKVIGYDTAKEIWDALKRLHQGNDDVKKDRIITLEREYENLFQGKNESLHDYHSRFQSVVNQLEFLGEKLPQWKQTNKLISGLNKKCDGMATSLLSQKDTKSMTVEDVIGQLTMLGGIQQRREDRFDSEKVKTIALKVEKAFDIAQGQDDEEVVDDNVALIS